MQASVDDSLCVELGTNHAPLNCYLPVFIQLDDDACDQNKLVRFVDRDCSGGLDACNTTCPITMENFFDLLKQRHVLNNKGLIIAQVMNRDPHCPGKKMISYYDGISLLRVLFKRETGSVKHRYSEKSPYVPKNPLSNSPILGEVLFFFVDHESIVQLMTISSANNNQNINNNLENGDAKEESRAIEIPAKFIGTDYNFGASEKLRKTFVENSLQSDSSYVEGLSNL
jgi:hypothetical protein